MGTSNFYYRNASKVFAIGLDYEQPILDEDGNETDEMESVSCETWEYDEQRDYIFELLKEFHGKNGFDVFQNERRSQLDNSNFSAGYIATISKQKYFGDVNCDVEINCFYRCGYYEGACLDWEIVADFEGITYDKRDVDVLDIFAESVYTRTMNAGMLKIQGTNAQKWFDKTINEMINIVEDCFTKGSTTFQRVATFSNGETIYEKCD